MMDSTLQQLSHQFSEIDIREAQSAIITLQDIQLKLMDLTPKLEGSSSKQQPDAYCVTTPAD